MEVGRRGGVKPQKLINYLYKNINLSMELNQLSECVEASSSRKKSKQFIFEWRWGWRGWCESFSGSCIKLWKMLFDLHRERIIFAVEIEKSACLHSPPTPHNSLQAEKWGSRQTFSQPAANSNLLKVN